MKPEKKSWLGRLLSMVDTWGEIALLVLICLGTWAVLEDKPMELIKFLWWDGVFFLVLAVGGVKAVPPGSIDFRKKK